MIEDVTVMYDQPKLPWFKRMFGMEYGPEWRIGVMRRDQPETTVWSKRQPRSPTPTDVMAVYAGISYEFFEQESTNVPEPGEDGGVRDSQGGSIDGLPPYY